MTAAYLAPLDRAELDEFMHLMEHAEQVAHIALVNAPLDRHDEAAAEACGVCQEVMGVLLDVYDASQARFIAFGLESAAIDLAAEFDRVFDLAGDPPEYQPDEDGDQ